jgi:hypothetical protein
MAEHRSDQTEHEAASGEDAQLNASLVADEDTAEPDSHYRYELVLRRAAGPQQTGLGSVGRPGRD